MISHLTALNVLISMLRRSYKTSSCWTSIRLLNNIFFFTKETPLSFITVIDIKKGQDIADHIAADVVASKHIYAISPVTSIQVDPTA